MLYVLIPTAWLAVVLFGLILFRLAARSDDSGMAAMVEWSMTSYLAEGRAPAIDGSAERRPPGAHRRTYRATGS